MVAGARFCDAVIGRPLEPAHRQFTAWGRRDGVPSRDFERRASKNLETNLGASRAIASGFRDFNQQHKAARPLAVRLTASHMTMCQASSAVEHDAVATV